MPRPNSVLSPTAYYERRAYVAVYVIILRPSKTTGDIIETKL
jgi:hypothetical protein